jgi:hypothetical protein
LLLWNLVSISVKLEALISNFTLISECSMVGDDLRLMLSSLVICIGTRTRTKCFNSVVAIIYF